VSFWRKDVIDFALDQETLRHIEEQRAWIGREPGNARPYLNLSQLYRMCGRQEEALGLLLEAVRLDAAFAEAHVALAEIYAIRDDPPAAWKHARLAEKHGDGRGVALLVRHRVPEENQEKGKGQK
jgi:cytochrome c-type biogenesis protein CcmH/NrfG